MQLVATACEHLGAQDELAHSLVYVLAWVCLRFEELEDAESLAQRGLQVYLVNGDRDGVAQAKRHLGKAALLKAEYELDGSQHAWVARFEEARQLYGESLAERETLSRAGTDQRAQIADLQLDFGRLDWLWGRKLTRHEPDEPVLQLVADARRCFEEANQVSKDALAAFEQIALDRGIAKAHGNIGNATKELARLEHRRGNWAQARTLIESAQTHYEVSLSRARVITRRDEIAHALWGLAECKEFRAFRVQPPSRASLLAEAVQHARESHVLYEATGAGRDIEVTGELVERLQGALMRAEGGGCSSDDSTDQRDTGAR